MLGHSAVPGQPLPSRISRARALPLAPLLGFLLALGPALAETSAPPPPVTGAAPAQPAASHPARTPSKPKSGRRVTTPPWTELSPGEQQSLAPLASTWNTLSAAQKRKWKAVAHNFSALSADEQARLHSRMADWAALTPQQRTRARLNFGAAKRLSPDERKAKWEAYQALSPEEKRRLAAAATKPPLTAAPVEPVPQGKLAKVPRPRSAASRAAVRPRTGASAPAAPAARAAPAAPAAVPPASATGRAG